MRNSVNTWQKAFGGEAGAYPGAGGFKKKAGGRHGSTTDPLPHLSERRDNTTAKELSSGDGRNYYPYPKELLTISIDQAREQRG